MTFACRVASGALAVVMAAGCGTKDAPPAEPAAPITVADAGFLTPESVLYDSVADVYLVSNINGSPLDVDDNGFISRVSPDGQVLTLKWIDGASDQVTLSAPKGMAIVGDVLYVTDITVVRKFDRTSGAPLGEIAVAGSMFLNDLAPAGDGGVYLTDTGMKAGANGFEPAGTDAVYHIAADGAVHRLATGDALGRPNGVLAMHGDPWVVTFGAAQLYRVHDGAKMDSVALPSGGLDGLVAAGDQLLVSSWDGQAVYKGPMGGPFAVVVDSVESPADIGYDSKRHRVLIPLFNGNAVRIVPMKP